MKFGESIKYNMRYIFLEKLCIKYGREICHKTFSKKSNLSKSLDQQPEISYSLFLLYV